MRWHVGIATRAWAILNKTVLSDSNFHCLVSKGRKASKHLTDKNSKAPYICLVVVSCSNEDFRGGVCWCATVCPDTLSSKISQLLGEPEVDQFNVTFAIKQDVLRLKVTIDNIFLMKLLDSDKYLSEVE